MMPNILFCEVDMGNIGKNVKLRESREKSTLFFFILIKQYKFLQEFE